MDDSGKTSLFGRTLGHYRIIDAIGAGGMGEVYRATDAKLGREIALKVLPPEVATDPDRLARFQREARVVAGLNHPNVVTVYSVEEADGVHFITMELVEGQPLDRLISASGLPGDRIIEIAGAIAEALAAAHQKGIVHRDLKAANVMVTNDGRVKVLDFGLAKDIGPDSSNNATMTSAGHTQAGIVMGTPAYMSPEQVSGRPLDHRTDIFSFGVLLHEMAAGKRPFEGGSAAELISSILRDSPPPVTDLRPELPADLARVIRRCLEKDPRYRMQTARDISNEFRDLARTTGRSIAAATSSARAVAMSDSGAARADEGFWVAVLPFRYKGTDRGMEILAEGLTEEVIAGLSRFSYLRVVARSSTAKYTSESGDVRGVGKELGARYVMEGSVRQAGARVRVMVQLSDSAGGMQLWTETYERPFDSEAIFNLQDDLVPRIVSTVADAYGVLPHTMSLAVRRKDPALLTPYEALLRSFSYAERVTAEEHIAAKAALKRAVQQSPNSSDCWAMLSILQTDGNIHGLDPEPDSLDDALRSAQRAVDTAPTNHKAYQALAWVRYFRKEFPSSLKAAERTLALNPMDGAALVYAGQTIAFAGDWERGCSLILRATELNPNHAGWYWYTPFLNAYRKNDYRGALDYALKINMPGFPLACIALAAVHGQLGQGSEAQHALRELLTLRPDYASLARAELRKIWDDQLVEHLIDGLRKAGLDIVDDSTKPTLASWNAVGTRTGSGAAAVQEDEGFWVAVLPFKYAGGNADVRALAEGLSEEIITGLSRFSYLHVIARGSTAKYTGESGDVRAIGKELGARYVMDGSLRQAGSKLRLAVQLNDTVSGAHLWAETYERAFHPDAIFELQDELVPRIVSTVADMNGVLTRRMSEAVRSHDPEQLSPYQAVLRGFCYGTRATPEELSAGISALELAVRKAPSFGDAWGALAQLYGQDYAQGFNLHADSLARALSAAQRAVELAPTNHLGYCALAQALFFRKEFQSFRNAAERAIVLNSMDGNSVAFLGELLIYTGDAQRGLELAGRAKQLNPNHPGWYWYADFYHAYRQGDDRAALNFLLKVNLPGHWFLHAAMAAAHGQLGEIDAAGKAIQQLLKLRPDFAGTVRKDCDKWWSPEYVERFIEGLRKAGLDISGAESRQDSSPSAPARTVSGAARVDEGFWVAVLPFKYTGSNADLKALAEGLSEEVVTGLSRFSYLRVIARGSTAKYSSESADVRAIGKELGARYLMEASLRQAGSKLRLAVQLADTVSGAHLWAETYERAFNPEAIFELQDELVPRIVATVADQHGVLPHSMSEVLRQRSDASLTPHEAVLRAFGYFERITAEEHAKVRQILEKAVAEAPAQSDPWAMLSNLYWHEHGLELNPLPDSLGRAQAAARRAVEAAPTSHLAHHVLAACLFFQKDILGFRREAERCMELNPLDSSTTAFMGILLAYTGEWERGCALVERATQLNPNHPGWYHFAPFLNAYRKGDYTTALKFAVKIDLPGYQLTFAARAAVLGQLGEVERAKDQLRQLHALRPDAATSVRRELGKWYQPDLIEHWIDGLRKAGLEIVDDRKQTASGAVAVAPSIAVLPFANMSDDKEQDYFSDGLAEEIINLLAQIPALKVIARTSAFAFRGKEQDVRGIAEALGVNTVLEGSVRRSGSRIRVTAQLINAADGSHLWSERYDRELSDIFAVQDEISAAIAKALRVKLSREVAPQRYTPKIEAYEAYLKGRQHQGKVTPESLELARRYYEQAIELDPAFGMAHIGLAFYWMTLAHFGQHSVHEGVSAARAEVQRALQIDASLADGHALLGYLAALFDSDYAAAEKHFAFPMAKQASFELVRPMYGGVLYLRGNAKEAIKLAQRAIAEDPLDAWAHMNLHAYLQAAGREDEALQQLKKVVELDPNQVVALVSMVMIHAHKGEIGEALKIARRAYAVGRWFPDTVALLAALLRRNGEEEESRLIAQDLGSGEALGEPRAHALFHLTCGEIDQGADWVEKAIEQRDSSMRFYLGFVICKGLRASHRWPKIAKMVNL